ncbi:MAG: hypothetical protein ACLR6I_17670 [Waltera sp.]
MRKESADREESEKYCLADRTVFADSCLGLLMADRGENEFPVFACSEALSGESGSTGLLLQQNMWEVVPLLGYGIVEQQGTQNPEEDETTCRTLTTEDLISEELLLPQPEETQQTALIPESVEATAGTALSNFRPAVQQVQIDRTQLADYETLVRNFYAIDANTMAGSDQLSVEKLLGMDMTLPQEGDGPQILIYHTPFPGGFCGFGSWRCEHRYRGSGRVSDQDPDRTIWLPGAAQYRSI